MSEPTRIISLAVTINYRPVYQQFGEDRLYSPRLGITTMAYRDRMALWFATYLARLIPGYEFEVTVSLR